MRRLGSRVNLDIAAPRVEVTMPAGQGKSEQGLGRWFKLLVNSSNPTVTIDDRSEGGAWERALRDTPQVDRNLGRDK